MKDVEEEEDRPRSAEEDKAFYTYISNKRINKVEINWE